MWPDERVVKFVEANFTPVRVHVREQAEAFQRLGNQYGAHWTPTTLVLDDKGVERHRTEGFLPADDFLAQLELGVAKVDLEKGDWKEAERHFQSVADTFKESDAAPEALYWEGVARYKESQDAGALADTAKQLSQRFGRSSWAKKASVWAPAAD